MRRLEACDAAAFLVDQHRRIRPPDRVAQGDDEAAQLVRIVAIALKQDEAEWIGVTEEVALDLRERRAGAAEDDGARLTA